MNFTREHTRLSQESERQILQQKNIDWIEAGGTEGKESKIGVQV